MLKKIIIIIIIVLLICFVIFNNKKFYLDDKYYNNGDFITINAGDYENIKNDSYVLFTYNNYCNLSIPCDEIFQAFMSKYKIDFISMPIEELKKTELYKKVKYAPSIIIIKEGKIKAYLDANKNSDLAKYQDVSDFEKWISRYIYLKK